MLVSYEVACDLLWHTRHVAVECNIGSERNSVVLTVDSSGAWHSPTEERPTLRDCTDIDLAVSPATNTIPIRRLNLEVGQSRDVVAAWLKFPHLALETLSQRYTRLDSQRYLYQTSAGFSADLLVDDLGLITLYPCGWERVASV